METIITPFGSEENFKKHRIAYLTDRAFNVAPQSKYTILLIQNAVNNEAGEFLKTGAQNEALKYQKRDLADTEKWELDKLDILQGRGDFDSVVSGEQSLFFQCMQSGIDPDWIMVSAINPTWAAEVIMGSVASPEYKHDLEVEISEWLLQRNGHSRTHAVDFSNLRAAAQTIKQHVLFQDLALLAWHLGRVPNTYSDNFRDTEKFLDQIEESLVKARVDLKERLKKETQEKEESEKRSKVDRRAEIEAGRTCVANIETDRDLIDWAKSKGLMVYIERKRKKYPEALNKSKWSYLVKGQWDDDLLGRYRKHLHDPGYRNQEPLINQIHELKGKLLVGEHYPKPSHGDILAELANAV